MKREDSEVGEVLSNEQVSELVRKGQDNWPVLREAVQANGEAFDLNSSIDSAEHWKKTQIDPQLARASNTSLPDEVRQEAASHAVFASTLAARRSEDQRQLSEALEKELTESLSVLPADQRAAFTAGFLRHHDLIRTEGPNGNFVYERNPDEPQAQAGNYIPAAAINRER